MADNSEEFTVKIKTEGGDEAADQIDSLSESLGDLEEQSESTTSKIESYTEILENSIGIAQDVFNGVVALAEALQEAAQEYERIASVVRNFDGDVTEASDAVNGFISDLDIMTAANRAAQAGLNLSANELRSVSVAAVNMAQSTGGDAKQALDQLTEALIGASADGLQKFNIAIEASGNKTRDQINALNALTERYGDATVEIQSFTQRIVNGNVELENMKTAFVRGAESIDALDDSFNRLNATMSLIPGSPIISWLSDAERQGAIFAGTLSGIIDYLNELIHLTPRALNGSVFDFMQRGAQTGLRQFGEQRDLQRRSDEITNNTLPDVRGNIARFEANAARNGGGGGGGQREETENFFDMQQRFLNELEGPMFEAQTDIFNQIIEQTRGYEEEIELVDYLGQLTDQRVNTLKEEANLRNAAIIAADQENQAIMRNLEADQRRLQVLQEAQANAERYQNIQQGISTGANQLATLTMQAFDNIKNENMSIGEGIKLTLKGWLKSFAKQEGFKAISAFAEAAGLAFINPPAAAGKAQEGAMHAALAAAAGGGGAAIKGGSKPSGGGNPATNGQGGGTNEGPSQNLTINIQGQMYMTQAEVGRAINDAIAASNRRY